MGRLYELTDNYLKVADMLYDENIDAEAIQDTMESITGEIEDKADNYAKIIKELEAMATARKAEADRLTKNAKILENRAKWLKTMLQLNMQKIGKTKFTTDLFNFSVVKNGGKQALTIDGEVSEDYTRIVVENDTDKIRQALENGQELAFAHLEPRGESLRIK